jgi:hypothetical protein
MVEEGAEQLNVQLVLLGAAALGIQVNCDLGAAHFLVVTHNISTPHNNQVSPKVDSRMGGDLSMLGPDASSSQGTTAHLKLEPMAAD